MKNKKKILIVSLILVAVSIAARLLPHLANIAPIGALALFAGVYSPFSKGRGPLAVRDLLGFIFPLAAMLISDIFIGFYEWPVMLLVYGSFLAMVAIGHSPFIKGSTALAGRDFRGEGFALRLGLGALSGSVIFFLATNFGTWAFTNLYPHTFDGLMWAYTMGLPFFKWTVIGDLAWSVAFFGGYALVSHLLPFAKGSTRQQAGEGFVS